MGCGGSHGGPVPGNARATSDPEDAALRGREPNSRWLRQYRRAVGGGVAPVAAVHVGPAWDTVGHRRDTCDSLRDAPCCAFDAP
jgi:hypothetical protein